jgi:hypothetical protein
MLDPKLTLGFAERGGQPVLLISRNDSQLLNRSDWGLAQLAEAGYMGACDYIGDTVLRMLAVAHPDALAPYPALSPSNGPAVRPSDMISLLHHQSLVDRTCRYVPAIDALVELHKDDLANTSVLEQWPTFRAHIMRTYPG